MIIQITDILNKQIYGCNFGRKIKQQLEFLCGSQEPRPRYFYMLPKIHKETSCWTIQNVMPAGRPIISDCNSE